MLRRSFLFFVMLILAVALVYAQEKRSTTEITGYLVDNMCATGSDAKDKEHPVSCALMPKCVESGFAVVSKDTIYKLDENGNKLALDVVKNTETKKGLTVQVKGTIVDGVLQTESLAEVKSRS